MHLGTVLNGRKFAFFKSFKKHYPILKNNQYLLSIFHKKENVTMMFHNNEMVIGKESGLRNLLQKRELGRFYYMGRVV